LYTKGGDKGETSLYGPKRVPKDAPRVEAYGAVDELNSYLGVVLSGCEDGEVSSDLKDVQRMLFVAGADLAAETQESRVPRISSSDTDKIEKMTDALLLNLPTLNQFILPGGTMTAAELQYARAICRRAERRIVSASRDGRVNPELIPFFNRLSSYLFNLARGENKKKGESEEPWRAT